VGDRASDFALSFRVAAVPKPQGSKRGFVVKGKDGGRPRAIVVDSAKEPLRSFRDAVRAEAVAQGVEMFVGPVSVALAFSMPKPKVAERGPRRWPIGKNVGDIDKLARACLDALTDAGIWHDDSQVVELIARKDYPGTRASGDQPSPGVAIVVRPYATEVGGAVLTPQGDRLL